ncbi:MAG: tRNA (guanosine(46)-N7)-methyltransferase TrmB, partial [Lachnospiraceae bacterium]|nr:tRNA (guanosine(46)-N7)-methyltransferase TrmB [Lachnospiraceae bacterium]
RRLTSDRFLARYARILAPEGRVEFKTDNTDLFDFSLESAESCGWTLSEVTRDLHNSPAAEGNVMTEYEERFSALGNPICRLVATPPRQ